ncbi:MAG: flagellar hook-basal body complex protein FliE [Chloroflexi bacterium]|nr:flagellar hook-basal body complex protein FliE [Chloroflexota bacterium]
MNIPKIDPRIATGAAQPATKPKPTQSASNVTQTFADALDTLSRTQENSDDLLQRLAAGEDVDIHQAMIATEQTDIQFQVAMGIRDRLVEAYREVMRMQV